MASPEVGSIFACNLTSALASGGGAGIAGTTSAITALQQSGLFLRGGLQLTQDGSTLLFPGQHCFDAARIYPNPLQFTLSNPWGVVYDALGHLFVTNTSANSVVRLTTAGVILAVFTFSPPLNNPHGLAIDSFGALYVADTGNERVVKFAADGTQLLVFTVSSPAFGPFDLAIDASNSLWIADAANGRVVQLLSNGAVGAVVTTSNPALTLPLGVAVDASGAVYIADTLNDRLLKRYPNGTIFTLYAGLFYPQGVLVDWQGNVLISDASIGVLKGVSYRYSAEYAVEHSVACTQSRWLGPGPCR